MVREAGVFFWRKDDLGISFSRERYKQPVRIAVDRCFPYGESPKLNRTRHESCGVSGCQGTPWSEELDGKELYGALGGEGDLETRESIVFCTSSSWSQPTFQHLLLC